MCAENIFKIGKEILSIILEKKLSGVTRLHQ
jgi:hypothetical protein